MRMPSPLPNLYLDHSVAAYEGISLIPRAWIEGADLRATRSRRNLHLLR
jgi:hypothetical protein